MNIPGAVACGTSLTAAENMRDLRKRRGWSQHRLALEAGLSSCMISFLETGQRNLTLPMAEKIARALETSVHELLTPSPRRSLFDALEAG